MKKKSAKATKKAETKKSATIPNASSVFMAIYREWLDGAQISTLSAKYNVKRSKLRRQLIQQAGGKEKFRELRSTTGAGGTAEAFGGKRATPRTKETIALDDSKAQRIESTQIKPRRSAKVIAHMAEMLVGLDERISEARTTTERLLLRCEKENAEAVVNGAKKDAKRTGWWSSVEATATGSAVIVIDPSGQRFVPARSTERADLIVPASGAAMPDARFRLEATSGAKKAERKAEAQLERGEALLAKKSERSKARKVARKTRR